MKIFKRKTKREIKKYDTCPNCGSADIDNYCANCGQANKNYDQPIKELITEVFTTFNLDIRFLNTILPFLFKPGFLSVEYFKGKRKRYVPPVRMYMLLSILFFFIAKYNGNKRMENIDLVDIQSTEMVETPDTTQNNIEAAIDINEANEDEVDILITKMFENINTETGKQLFLEKFFSNLSYLLFLMMPFFALITKLLMRKKRMKYIKHLIFSINFHSFIFALAIVEILINMPLPTSISTFSNYILVGIPIYLTLGIRRFYEVKIFQSLLKTIGILFIYSITLIVTSFIILIFTFSSFI